LKEGQTTGHGLELAPLIKEAVPFLHAVPDMVIYTWIIMVVMIGISFLARRKMEMIPSGWQNAMELAVDSLAHMIEGTVGKKSRKIVPLIITFFFFILFCNYSGVIPGFKPPTADLNTPIALALVVFFSVHIVGMAERGILGYWKHFLEPFPLMLPLNIIEELAKVVSLSLRLFGNIMGEKVVVAVLFMLVPYLVPVPMQMFGLFTGTIQAFVFTILTTIYLSNVMGDHH